VSRYFVNEIYRCLQGEGFNIGKPAVLVRFQICNLRCVWCDTPQAQERRVNGVDPTSYSLEDLVAEIERVSNMGDVPIRHAIFTGGEPTIHPIHRVRKALGAGWTVEVETNGTRVPHREFSDFSETDYALFQWNVSPKGNAAGESIEPQALCHWGQLSRESGSVFLKCVVRKAEQVEDLAEVGAWENDFGFLRDRIFLMPEGTSRESQAQAEWLHDVCVSKGYRLAIRLHVVLFGNKKGV
jgi:7-carboxy-7-deazaguanine synthase